LNAPAEQNLKWCFPAGTLVDTPSGLRAIEAITAGEQVWGYDLVASAWRPCVVQQTFCTDYEGRSVFVTVAGEQIASTFLHPYWVVRGQDLEARPRREHLPTVPLAATTPGRWVDAGDVRVGDCLLLRDGRVAPVDVVRVRPFEGLVYNFAVGWLACYAVGRQGALVHNSNSRETEPGGSGPGEQPASQPGGAPRTPSGLPATIHDLGVAATKGEVTHANWVAQTTAQQRQQMIDFFREAAGRVNVQNAPGAREFNLYRARWLETGQGPAPGKLDNFRRNILPTLPPNFGG
jgi:hypothetical protein